MKIDVLSLGKQTVIYGLGDALYKAVAFFLLPVYLKYLTPAEYGTLETLMVTRGLVVTLIMMGLSSAVFRFYYRTKNDKIRTEVLSTIFFLSILLQITIPLVFWSQRNYISRLILNSPEFEFYISIISLNIFFLSFKAIPLSLFRAQKKPLAYTMVNLAVSLVTLGMNVVFVAFMQKGIAGVLYGNICGGALGFTLLLPVILKEIRFSFNRAFIYDILSFSIPLALAAIPLSIIFMADRYFIVYLSTKHELGIYSLAYKLGSIIKLSLVTPLALSWGPYIFSIENEKNAMEKYMGVFKLYTIGGLLVVTLLSVYSIEVLSFLTSTNEYIKAVKIIPIICYAFFIFGLSPIVRTGILLSGKTYLSTIDVTIAMLFNLLSNYILIDLFEVYGAAFSLLLTMILLIFLHSRNSFVVYNLKFNFYLFLENISVSIFTVVFSLIFILFDFKHGFCYRTCIVIIFLRYLYSRGGMSVTEKQKLIAAISQPVLYFFKRKKQDV